MMSTLLKLGSCGYEEKNTLVCVPIRISPTKSTISFRKIFLVALDSRHICKKNEPTLDQFFLGGGGAQQVLLAHSLQALQNMCLL